MIVVPPSDVCVLNGRTPPATRLPLPTDEETEKRDAFGLMEEDDTPGEESETFEAEYIDDRFSAACAP